MEQLFGALPAVLEQIDVDPSVRGVIVFAAWRRICGELIRARTAPIGFAGHRLVIGVEDKTWQRHLEDLSPQMVGRLNSALGDGSVRFIEFVIDASAVAAVRERTAASDEIDSAAEIDPRLRSAAEAIGDPYLRESFLKTAAVYLARQRKESSGS